MVRNTSYSGIQLRDPLGDALANFDAQYKQGQEARYEKEAPDAFAKYLDSLGLSQQQMPQQQAAPMQAPSDALVSNSHNAAAGAEDPLLAAFFANTRRAESGGNDAAKNPNSSATGRYQFIEGTWNDLMKNNPELGLTPDGRTDPAQQERAMRAFTQQNIGQLRQSGVPINPGSLYAAHFLGAGGASKVLAGDPNSPVSAYVDPGVIQANPQLADMTVGQFQQWAAEKGGGSNGGYQPPMAEQPTQPMQTASAGGMPDRETMLDLFRNPITRPLAIDAVKTAQATGSATPLTTLAKLRADLQAGRITPEEFAAAAKKETEITSGTTVNVDTAGNSGAFGKKADELAAGRMDEIVLGGSKAQEFMGDLEALRQISTGLNTGKEAEIINALGPYAEMVGFDISGLGEGQAYDAIISRMAPQMRVAGSGASSDFDAKQFLKSLPGLGKTPEGNQLIIDTFQGIQDHKVRAAEIASLALSGEIKWQEADKRIRALPNPYEAFKKANKDGGGTPPPARATKTLNGKTYYQDEAGDWYEE